MSDVIKPSNFKLGADPELFLRSKAQGKPWVSAHDLVLGTKDKPHPIDGGAVQHDGMAAEYNIDPATTAKSFVDNNMKVLLGLSGMLPDHELVNRPFVTFGQEVWATTPKEAQELGCDPDINAYTRAENNAPEAKQNFRCGGGHIHLGWDEGLDLDDYGHGEACNTITKELDIFLALPAVWLENGTGAAKRRELYGKAGAYRIKSYGMEYRTLSNFWVGNEILTRWVFDNAKLAFTNLLKGESLIGKVDAPNYINTTNQDTTDSVPYLCEEFGIPLPKFD